MAKGFYEKAEECIGKRKEFCGLKIRFFVSQMGENETKLRFLRYKQEENNNGEIVRFYSENTDS